VGAKTRQRSAPCPKVKRAQAGRPRGRKRSTIGENIKSRLTISTGMLVPSRPKA
jgi:hypothetical protein